MVHSHSKSRHHTEYILVGLTIAEKKITHIFHHILEILTLLVSTRRAFENERNRDTQRWAFKQQPHRIIGWTSTNLLGTRNHEIRDEISAKRKRRATLKSTIFGRSCTSAPSQQDSCSEYFKHLGGGLSAKRDIAQC